MNWNGLSVSRVEIVHLYSYSCILARVLEMWIKFNVNVLFGFLYDYLAYYYLAG